MKKIIFIITLMFVSLILGNTSIFAGEEVITSERLENNSELKVFFNRLLSEKIFRADSITVAKGIEIIGIYQNKNRANIYCYIDTVVKKIKLGESNILLYWQSDLTLENGIYQNNAGL